MLPEHSETAGCSTKKKRVLIVDDIRTDLHFVGKLVSGFDHEVILAESAASALELADGSLDLIIADGIMPGMDGFEFVRAVRENPVISHIPVIMVTSLSGKKDRIKAVEVGINDFINKPVDRVELKVRMDSMLRMKEAQDRVREYQKELEHLVEKKTFALNTTLQKLQAVLNGMNDCMVTVDRHLKITEMNQAFIKICGKSQDTLKGMPFNDLLIGTAQLDGFASLFSRSDITAELDMEFPQWGRKIFSVLATPMEDQGHLLMMRDITEKKQADEQRARFLSILSHELRTPLNGIKGFSEIMLIDPFSLPENYREYVGLINECGCKLESIVEELLRFVEFYSDMGEPEELDIRLDVLVEYVLDALSEKKNNKNIHVSIAVEGPPPIVHGKNEHLFEILKQITDNALKFSRDNGSVEIILRTTPESVHFICLDHGKGIPEKDLGQVFESFYQVEDYSTRTQDGLGLGLTIARKIIELYKGTIDIKSAPGVGTNVTVTLPKPL
jgi:PAS domain S-box-containing protein